MCTGLSKFAMDSRMVSDMEIEYDDMEHTSTIWTVSTRGLHMGVRTLIESDLPAIESMIQGEKWVKSAESVQTVQALSSKGALVAINEERQPIAFITSVDLGPHDTAVLYIIVDKQYRRLGIGRELISGLSGHGGEKVISLLSFPGSENFYFDLGFKVIENMTINVNFLEPDYDTLLKKVNNTNNNDGSVFLAPKTTRMLTKIANYDKKVCGYDRRDYLSTIAFPETSCLMVATKGNFNQDLDGYCGASIVNGDSLCIAPLYAKSKEVAENLFTKVLLHCKDRFDFKQVKVIPPANNSFLTSFGTITKTVPLQMMSNGDINFGLAKDVYSCINTSFP